MNGHAMLLESAEAEQPLYAEQQAEYAAVQISIQRH